MLRYLVEDKATPAVVVGILEADGSTRVVSQGTAGAGARPLGPRSVFEIGSINKTFTGTLLADMVTKGEVALADPISKVGVVMLTNTTQFPDDVAQDFLRRGPPLAVPEVKVASEVLETYVGDYEVAPGRIMSVRLEPEGWLRIRVPNNVRFRMYAQSDNAFFVKRAPWRFTFQKDAAGKGVEPVGDLDGTERRGRKVGG